MKHLSLLVFGIIVCLPRPLICGDGWWFKVKEFEDSFIVDLAADKIEYIRPLIDLNGKTLYTLYCRGGSEEYLDKLSDQTGITHVGVLGCSLVVGDKEEEVSLLAEDESPAWHTRGQYHESELIGDCGNYPEYGRVRHFRLRGFELTLSADDLAFSKSNQLKSFRMKVSLKRDKRIQSPQAEQPGFLRPAPQESNNCKKILKGNAQRMCRNPQTYSWEPCTVQ